MIYFIADMHFSEENIMRYENRPFKSIMEMNKELITLWNGVVSKEDFVYVLGDFGATNQEDSVSKQLKGTKLLVKGNHDTNFNHYYRKVEFQEVPTAIL